MSIEERVTKEKYEDEPNQKVNDTDYFGNKSRIIVEMISRWGMVAGIPDGEDSSGRSKLRLSTEEELVNRAFKISDLMFNELELRDLMIQTSTFENMDLAVKNIIEEKENNKLLEKH